MREVLGISYRLAACIPRLKHFGVGGFWGALGVVMAKPWPNTVFRHAMVICHANIHYNHTSQG